MAFSTSGGDHGRRGRTRPAVHDAVADGDGGCSSNDGPCASNASSIAAKPAAWSAIGSASLRDSLAGDLVAVPGRPGRLADALDEARRQRPLAVELDQLVLERRRTGVHDEDRAHEELLLLRRARVPRLDRGDGDGVDDVGTSAPRDRSLMGLRRPCSIGPDRDGAGAALHRLVGVVARVEVGEDEHRRAAGDLGVGHLRGGDRGSAAASYWIGPSTSRSGRRSRTRAVAARTFSTSAPEPDCRRWSSSSIAMRGSMPNCAAVSRRRDRDVGELLGRRVGDDGAVAVDEHAVGERHEEHARDDADAGQRLDDLEGRPDGVRRGVRGARDHAVGEAELHHHGAEVRDVGDGVDRLSRRRCPCGRAAARTRSANAAGRLGSIGSSTRAPLEVEAEPGARGRGSRPRRRGS